MSPAEDYTTELVRSFDGTQIAARHAGEGDALPLLVSNAIGATPAVWDKVLVDVVRNRRVFLWDHRGLFDSSPPASDRIDPGAHAEDAIALLDHFDIDRCLLASWSTGGRIALEIAHRYPERVAALAVVNGGYGHPMGRVLRLEVASLFPSAAGIAKHFAGPLHGAFKALVTRPEFAGLVRQSGMLAASADIDVAVDLLRAMADLDLRLLLANYEAVMGEPAQDLLDEIEPPVLLIAGERDQFTSLAMMEQMRNSIPGARLDVYERATHYLPLEYPGKLSTDLRAFFDDVPSA
jgi:3-oxoadipate enol-lactonase